jgi:hypothetical protein
MENLSGSDVREIKQLGNANPKKSFLQRQHQPSLEGSRHTLDHCFPTVFFGSRHPYLILKIFGGTTK